MIRRNPAKDKEDADCSSGPRTGVCIIREAGYR